MPFAWGLIGFTGFAVVYAYVLYPLLLMVLAAGRRNGGVKHDARWEWPRISITIPVFNEVGQIDDLLESVLRLDYPADRMQILVVSDCSDDGTDERVKAYSHRGVELLRMPTRGGKTAGENAARSLLTGDIVVNTDASIRIDRAALKPMVSRFRDPTVGLASGRDVSVTRVDGELNVGESSYVGYEMWVRSLETDVSGIVGASGCFYAIRQALHQEVVPSALSRDFASAMVTREHGYRAVTVNEAVCYVPRVPSLRREYRRKVRTITRGMETLYFKRALLNPFRYGLFSWMLFSHKICRWLAPWAALIGFIGLVALAFSEPLAWIAVGGVVLLGVLALIGWQSPEGRAIPRLFSMPAFLVVGNAAVLHATINALTGELNAVWEPTRRDSATQGSPALIDR
jgi:cellulose synthase/poly-beta-1,6-N-acetylglucosamine synthase-like glycosyltransferase